MLPRYLVVISRNDLALPQDEVYFEDDDGGDGSEELESVSTLFGKVSSKSIVLSARLWIEIDRHHIRLLCYHSFLSVIRQISSNSGNQLVRCLYC